MVWEASPRIVVANVGVRLIVSLLPLAMLAVTKVIIDSIYNYTANHTPLPAYFWWLVISEFALACISTILVRVTDYCDTVLADKYAKHVSVRIMQHASRLDLTTYEDPTFQDKLERARVQGTDCVRGARVPGRNAFRIPRLFLKFRANACAARNGISARAGGQQGKRKGTEALWHRTISGRAIHKPG